MIWGRYPTEKDIAPISAHLAQFVKGREQKALERACEEAEKELGVFIRPQVRQGAIRLKPGAVLLPEFPATVVKLQKDTGEEVDATEYTVDSERAVLFSDLVAGEYWVDYQVGYPEGKLPATIQMILVAFGKFFLCEDPGQKAEALELARTWQVVRKRVGEMRDGVLKTG